MYAVVKTGGKQYRVEEGGELVVQKLDAAVGDAVDFDVLFFSDGSKTVADPDDASTASVTAEVVEQFKDDKVIVFKFKKRKGYKKTRGHRQQMTRVKITSIAAPSGAKKAAKPKPKAEAKAPEPKAEVKAKAPEPKAEPAEAKAPVAEAPEVEVVEAAEPDQCEALTGSGDRCKNKAKEGSKYCGVHAKKYEG